MTPLPSRSWTPSPPPCQCHPLDPPLEPNIKPAGFCLAPWKHRAPTPPSESRRRTSGRRRGPRPTQAKPQSKKPAPPPQLPDESGLERLNGLDLAWMQERVSHLGAAYAVAQLGLGGADAGPPPASFASQSVDTLDGPPTLLFTGGAHDMAAFAASFDMAAPPPAAPPPAPTAPSAPRRRSYRGGAAIKEPVVCPVCGRVFPSAAAMEPHRRAHTGERPFACPHCGKGFAQPNNLRVHLLIHTGERRYRCTLCGKSFISSSHLKRHRTVHTQEKPYSCSRCGQAFSQMCSVRRHRQQSQCGL